MSTLRQLRAFVAVAEYKKMSEAAKKLYISQPTVSQMISDLEKEYEVQLFERLPKELKITPAGQLLFSRAQEIIAIQEDLEQSMKNINSKRPLRVGATLTIGNTMMGSLIEHLSGHQPDIDVSVFVDNTRVLEHRLIHNELDIALVEGVIIRDEIYTRPLIRDRLALLCGMEHPFAARESVSVEELKNQSFIMREKGSGTRAIFENLMHNSHIPITIKWECSSSTAIIDAVRHNLGLGVLSYRCVKYQTVGKEIKIVPLEGISMERSFHVCYNQNHPITSQMHDFIDEVKAMCSPEEIIW